MMISPENYCEEYLREKDAKQILSIIRGLKNECKCQSQNV